MLIALNFINYSEFCYPGEASIANIDELRHMEGTEPSAKVRLEFQKTMQNYAAVFRTGEVNLGANVFIRVCL